MTDLGRTTTQIVQIAFTRVEVAMSARPIAVSLSAVLLSALTFGCAYIDGDKDCADFRTQADAQRYLDWSFGDPDGLDGDNDGIACERLP